jgi:hypothetical protein
VVMEGGLQAGGFRFQKVDRLRQGLSDGGGHRHDRGFIRLSLLIHSSNWT